MKIHTHKSQSNFETYIFEVRYSFQTAKRFESFNSNAEDKMAVREVGVQLINL